VSGEGERPLPHDEKQNNQAAEIELLPSSEQIEELVSGRPGTKYEKYGLNKFLLLNLLSGFGRTLVSLNIKLGDTYRCINI
jgi:hypothetical protein